MWLPINVEQYCRKVELKEISWQHQRYMYCSIGPKKLHIRNNKSSMKTEVIIYRAFLNVQLNLKEVVIQQKTEVTEYWCHHM